MKPFSYPIYPGSVSEYNRLHCDAGDDYNRCETCNAYLSGDDECEACEPESEVAATTRRFLASRGAEPDTMTPEA